MKNGSSDSTFPLKGGWQIRIKQDAWGKIDNSMLMKGCATGDTRFIVALLAGFWNFVDRFPGIIEATFAVIPSEASPRLQKFLKRSAPILAGTLKEMENDERNHRFLWLKAASMVDFEVDALMHFEVLPEIDKISTSIHQAELQEKLLAFVAVEIIAEGISQCLNKATEFKQVIGQKGMGWFNVHVLHPEDGTTHEDIAYDTVFQIYRANGTVTTEEDINKTIQKYVDLFIDAAEACRVAFTKGARVI